MILDRCKISSDCAPRSRYVALTLCGVLLGVWFAAPLRAAADDPATAEVQTERARDLINRGDYAGALEAFQAAFELGPSPLLMFNIAMCKKALSRHVDAIRSFKAFFALQAETRTINPKLQALAEEALEELYSLVGSLEVADAPEGAAVTVDGTPVGTTPLPAPYYLIPGKHTVTVAKEGFAPMETEITAAAGAGIVVRADLRRPLSRIEVACDEADAVVSLDGRPVGTCPYEAELPPGEYEVTVSAPGKKTALHRVTAEVRRTTVIAVDLEPLESAKSPFDRDPGGIPKPRPGKRVRNTGISLAALGAVGIGLGGMFIGLRNGKVAKANELADDIKAADQELLSLDRTAHDADTADRKARKDFLDDAGRLEGGAAAMVAVGGAALLAGAGLVTYYLLKRQKGEWRDRVEVSVDARGVTIGF